MLETKMEVKRNEAGQIYMTDASGNAFDMSKHVGDKFHTLPDLLAALREVTPEMRKEGMNARYNTDEPAHIFNAMLSAFERQMESSAIRRQD